MLLRTLICIAVLSRAAFGTDWALAGPYPVGTRSVTVTRADSSTFTAQIFYPASAAGSSQPFSASAAPAPAISFGHGFFQTVSRYQSTLSHLASHGYIVIASDSESGLLPSHTRFASDLSRCLTYLEQQNVAAGGFLNGNVNTARLGMFGHSMGGGCTILAASSDPRLRAIAPMAPADTNPSAIAAAPSVAASALLLVGDADGIVATATNGQPMYAAMDAPRQLANIRGGSHCGFLDANTLGCDAIALPRADQLAAVRRHLTLWFNLYLKGDQSGWPQVWGPGPTIDANTTVTRDARAAITPATSSLRCYSGATAEAALSVQNTDESVASFELRINGNDGIAPSPWPAAANPGEIFALAPAAQRSVSISVSPVGAGSQTLRVSAINAADNSTRAFATINITVACPADFNEDGGVDGADTEAFFTAWSSGADSADVNADGGIDGADVQQFFTLWEAGGCE
ncbi:MAG: alpha/beta hydrolase [Planctomycetes bacterium]|nr:alpha/beta hydrolase [Planctomycetota bacterium]